MENENNQENQQQQEQEQQQENNVNVETLTRDLIERDSEIARLKREKAELESAYKVLYERGNFTQQQQQQQSKETEKKVSYDDILKRL